MGKVMSLINMTADGFADGKHVITDAGFYDFTHGLLAQAGTIAFGRNTFEAFQQRWPAVLEQENAEEYQVRMAKALVNKRKVVYSSTLKTTTWKNSEVSAKVDPALINAYKLADKEGFLTIGSPGLVATLTEMKLIDDYYFSIQPLIAGHGDVRLFDKIKLDTAYPLKYVDSTQLTSGVQIIHYQSTY